MLRKYCALFLLALLPFSLRAWGVMGHRTVAKIAENHLKKKTKRQIAALLGTETVPLVSTWADEARYSPEYKETGPWHFVNLPDGLGYEQFATQLKAMTIPNAYLALQQNIQIVKDHTKSKDERVVALKFVIHIVGDVHQPMHISRAEDQGGNKIPVKYQGKDSNLHSLWDSGLVEYQGFTYSEMAQAYDHISANQIQQWQAADPVQWLFESYQISQQLYAEAGKSTDFDFRYNPAHLPTVEERITQAGIRLAAVLNTIFS
ncbi:S1/P1 nuclease [Hymenobacter cavernae]|uniref:Endonuclease n=1 Tax=Hymenobacter cavernae TaxID=2044852 RepID=A0ABQ1UN15_9BACT|nr:S1/P1 nuclease [Hymenobacter cavernae]GGF21311.1 endonuclease [Hymenobacter cavernae]